jgi:hypothetical protein
MDLDVNDLIRAFEPILYFAPGERFFPSDCKRYLERCSLWNAVPPFDDHNSWHARGPGSFPKPFIFPRQISGRSDEPGTFLGEAQGGSFPFLYTSGSDDGFLDLTGWTDGLSVSPTSHNRFANLDQIETLYNSSTSADPLLQGSRFWYHAEIFDTARLRRLMAAPGAQKFAWQFPLSNEATLATILGSKTYAMRVDRTNPNSLARQIWWSGIEGHTGYSGRWGSRVARDPKTRRAGMKFPEFWEMFMSAFAKSKS